MFETLKEYYGFINKDLSFQRKLNLSNKLTQLRDKLHDDNEKKKVTYEIYFSNFSFNKGKYTPLVGYTNGSCYPEKTLFEDFEYIKQRANSHELLNSKYKAKYNHLLWESPIKHIDFAKSAIDNYLEFLKSGKLSPKDNLSNHGFSQLFMNLFVLCQKVNYRKKDTLDFLLQCLEEKDLNGFQKYSLMSFICERGKKISHDYLSVFFDYSLKIVEDNIYKEFRKEFLQLLITLSKKLNKPSKDYHNMLGDVHMSESKKHDGSFVVHIYYLDALKQYQKAGNKQKIEEVTVLIEKAKDNLNLKLVKSEHSSPELRKWYDALRERTTKLVDEGSSTDIYKYLMLSKRIFPKAKVLEKKVKPVIMNLTNTMSFDINRNVSGKENSGINVYHSHIYNSSLQHLWLIFNKGSKKDKISFESLKNFLKNNTWYGKDITITNPDGEKEVFNWLELLLPSLESFFQQTEIGIKTNKNNNSRYMLAIDSLTLKFEGALRAFSRAIGAQTIDIKADGTQERISFEKLLENEKFKNIVPEDDIGLFKFLFTSKGLNLRNKIAHCFYRPKNYSVEIMWLLICVFLKLGNYESKNKN